MRRFSNWALLLIGVTFTAGGIVILPFDFNTGIVTIAFFGSCAVLPASAILRDLRSRPAPERVVVTGGVPIRSSRLFIGGVAAWVAIVAAICLTFGDFDPLILRLMMAGVLFLGCWVLVAVIRGRLPGTYLQFDPQGITFGYRRYSYCVEFDNIAALTVAEMNRNPVLLLQLHQPDLITAMPADAKMRVLKAMGRSERWQGAHIVLQTRLYRIDPSLMAQALDRYISQPSCRSELFPKAALPAIPR
jgi:hypothetical protein